MNIDKYGRIEITEDEAFAALYNGNISDLNNVFLNDICIVNQYNQSVDLNADNINKISIKPALTISIKEFDTQNQKNWFIPEEYKNFPIEKWLKSKCNNDAELQRVNTELDLFIQHNMYDLLLFLKYLVDTMRKHKIVWGVGRGSSVASYILFLIGVHKIDSLKYNLDIKEFLK